MDKLFSLNGKRFERLNRLEQEYFKSQIITKMKQAAGTWTAAERKLLPVLQSRLKKREQPIKKEIKLR